MNCNKCSNALSADDLFCTNCGDKIEHQKSETLSHTLQPKVIHNTNEPTSKLESKSKNDKSISKWYMFGGVLVLIVAGAISYLVNFKSNTSDSSATATKNSINEPAANSNYPKNTDSTNKDNASPEDAVAQYMLADKYYEAHEDAKALYWYSKSAEQGFADAQFQLGILYFIGDGVAQDYVKSVFWLKRAAEQGHAVAQYSVGARYAAGEGVKQDYVKAVYWTKKAAEQGQADAQFSLGQAYANGAFLAKNDVLALAWIDLALSNAKPLYSEEDVTEAKISKDLISRQMTAEQINEAYKLSSGWEMGQQLTASFATDSLNESPSSQNQQQTPAIESPAYKGQEQASVNGFKQNVVKEKSIQLNECIAKSGAINSEFDVKPILFIHSIVVEGNVSADTAELQKNLLARLNAGEMFRAEEERNRFIKGKKYFRCNPAFISNITIRVGRPNLKQSNSSYSATADIKLTQESVTVDNLNANDFTVDNFTVNGKKSLMDDNDKVVQKLIEQIISEFNARQSTWMAVIKNKTAGN